jgi:DNA polymerase I-like protein with 3'-5' exonuclease and polymerase domains
MPEEAFDGMWWERGRIDAPRAARIAVARGPVPPPQTGWRPPRELPNLAGARVLGIDTETKDLELTTRGPGAVRGAAHAVGISVATEDARWYFPLRHEYAAESVMNLEPTPVLRWLDELFSRPVQIVGANLLYDLEVLQHEGVRQPCGELIDVQFAEPLIDEESRSGYSLDSLGAKYTGAGKEGSLLYKWCADSFGGLPGEEQRKNIWRAPPSLVGPYAEADARLPLQVYAKQKPLLEAENLINLFKLECELIPLLIAMRYRGVRVDLERAQQVAKWLREEARRAQEAIPRVDVWSGDSIARAFDAAGAEYPRTEAGNPSFRKEWLAACEHPLAKAVLAVRTYEKAANPFVESFILGMHHNGRIHCQFNPLRSDEYGTVSGRFSSSLPNLQQIPSRDPILGPLLRSLFIPEEGCKWQRGDHSQIEYRLLVHYLKGRGADALRAQYKTDPTTNFHRLTQKMVEEQTGVKLDYVPAKSFNFGLVYGMGKAKIKRSLGVDDLIAERLYDAYFEALPSVKGAYNGAQRLATRRGYIKTILGRRRRFHDGEGAHKALNACLQGGAADILKKGMVDCYHAGVFNATGYPHLTIHDELDWSCGPGSEAAFAEAKRIMEQCVPLQVPLIFEMSTGANWGECK